MLKAIVSYSKKIPVPDSEYSSQGFSLSLESEIPESEASAIQARLHDTFELVKSTVESELANGSAAQAQKTAPEPQQQGTRRGAGSEKASNKQVKFLTDLATQRGIGLSELNGDIRRRYGVDGLYDLDKKQASALLDELNGRRKAA